MSGEEKYNPFENKSFSRISNENLSDEDISDGAKIVLTFLGGQFGLFENGRIETTVEIIAKGTGAKPILKYNIVTGLIISEIPVRQTKRNIKELRDSKIIKTKKLKHGIEIEFLEGTNMTPLDWDEKEEVSNMTPQVDKYDPSGQSHLYIRNKKETSLPLNFQLQTLKYSLPKDIRYKPKITFVLKDGIDAMGFDNLKNLLFDMRSQSHQDFVGALKERIKTAGYLH